MNTFHGGIKTGKTNVSLSVVLRDSSSSAFKTGITHSGISVRYWRQGETVQTVTPSALATLISEHTDGGWYEVDGSTMPGVYRLDMPDAAFAAAATSDVGNWVQIEVTAGGSLGWTERYALDDEHGFAEIWGEVGSATYGLSKLVRATTPANTLAVDASGNAAADLKLWKASAPADLTSTLVQAQANQLGTQAKADVDAECDGALETVMSELSIGAPTATPTIKEALMLIYMVLRNKALNDASYLYIYNSSGTVIAKAQVSESAGVLTRSAMVSGS